MFFNHYCYQLIFRHHESGNHPCIRREIKKETSTSKWFLNGREKTDKDVGVATMANVFFHIYCSAL